MITVIGYILTTLGFGGLAYSLFTVNTNKRYSWTSPFSSFEKTIIAVAIISFIILLVGIIMVIFSFVKKKNEDKLNSLKNLGNNNKCPNCGLNVTAGINECPRCHQKLNNIDGGFYNGKNNYESYNTAVNILQANGFKEVSYNGETVWKKGTGLLTAMQYIKIEFTDTTLVVSGWVQAGVGSVGGNEMALNGIVAAVPKKSVMKVIEQIKASL